MKYEFEGKTEQEAIERAVEELGLNADQFDVEILEIQKGGLFKKGYAKICIHVDAVASQEDSAESLAHTDVEPPIENIDEIQTMAVNFVTELIERMGHQGTVSVSLPEKRKMLLRISSDNSSILIGRKGKNLDAIQLLANVYVGNRTNNTLRIVLDCENYRIRREESLVRLAYTTADKVHTTKKSVLLEPMNPYERRLIHTTLNEIHDIETKSEGSGLYKQVRVSYKGR